MRREHNNTETHTRYNQFGNAIPDSPYFDRVDPNTEILETRKALEALHVRLRHMQNINNDLESRLVDQAKQTALAEKLFTDINRAWEEKYKILETENADWKKKYERQLKKNDNLREHLNRTEKELYVILQRKYQMMRGQPNSSKSSSSLLPVPPIYGNERDVDLSESTPLSTTTLREEEETTVTSTKTPAGHKLPKSVRDRKVLSSLSGFFGLV